MELRKDVVDGVHVIEHAFTNFFLLEGDGGVTVVDACVPSAWGPLQDGLRAIGRTLDDVRAVICTHAHFDHIGIAERARTTLGVPVHVHEKDVPLTRHPRGYDHERHPSFYFATQVQALPIVATFVRHKAFWPPPVGAVETFGDSGTLAVPGSPVIVPTPGHTDGHVAFHVPDRDVVFAGDAMVTLDPYTARRGPRLVARAATADVARNERSLQALAATGARVVLTGHGEPWTGGAEAGVAAALAAGAA